MTSAVDPECRGGETERRAAVRRKARAGGGRQFEVVIEELGGRGDGVAWRDGRPVFVPLALPGERLILRVTGERAGGLKAEIVELLEESKDRRAAPCPHFGPCGGCTVQHLAEERYLDWKHDQVPRALARRGLPTDGVRPLLRVPAGSRRRASLAARQQGEAVLLGFRERDSHRIVDIDHCLLLTPGLTALLPVLRRELAGLLPQGESAGLALCETDSGVDLLIESRQALGLEARERLAALGEACDLARLSWSAPGEEPEPVVQRRQPRVSFAGIPVTPPPGAFLQPSREGEALLTGLVLEALPAGSKAVADLFAGCGTFTFALAAERNVRAFEGDGPALDALEAAARLAGLHGRVGTERRDLARRPVSAGELEGIDALVFDPPRAGARDQCVEIAASALGAVVAVSCNPNTFARDARILVEGGFRLDWVAPVDQFPWSGHVELVASFRR